MLGGLLRRHGIDRQVEPVADRPRRDALLGRAVSLPAGAGATAHAEQPRRAGAVDGGPAVGALADLARDAPLPRRGDDRREEPSSLASWTVGARRRTTDRTPRSASASAAAADGRRAAGEPDLPALVARSLDDVRAITAG